ncbi:hypothetical protein JG687_00017002 [Phytophthora cactorum]|uniref:Uncharacterized protein n=1 Tax=Phytophthora cactorum TaxID=29920 RepID=A0A8T1TT26_9STRA|nr:hypothetical protein JG687_00017002 [Phytophthora cactorum]
MAALSSRRSSQTGLLNCSTINTWTQPARYPSSTPSASQKISSRATRATAGVNTTPTRVGQRRTGSVAAPPLAPAVCLRMVR